MENLAKYIEHTLLKQNATAPEFEKLYAEAKEYGFRGVCVNPAYVKNAKNFLQGTDVKIVTVIGFPLGANLTSVKVFEAKSALEDGADEIDMVINVSAIKDNNWEYVLEDIKAVKEACPNNVLKVILETDLLSQEEIKKACEICIKAKADFVKHSVVTYYDEYTINPNKRLSPFHKRKRYEKQQEIRYLAYKDTNKALTLKLGSLEDIAGIYNVNEFCLVIDDCKIRA